MHFYDYPFNPRGGIHNMNYSTRGERERDGGVRLYIWRELLLYFSYVTVIDLTVSTWKTAGARSEEC